MNTAVQRSGSDRLQGHEPPGRRPWLAVALGLGAVLFALLAVIGPAREHTQDYIWPPAKLPAASPTTSWYAPLYLSSRYPAAIDVRLPCSLPPELPGAPPGMRGVIVATARHADPAPRLVIRRTSGSLIVTAKKRPLVTIDWPPRDEGGASCSRSFHAEGGRWALTDTGGRPLATGGTPQFVVAGLLSSLDLAREPRLAVTVTADVLGTTHTARQTTFSILAATLALATLALALSATRAGRRHDGWARLRGAIRAIGLVDVTVVAVLALWCIVGPAFDDDGWIQVRERNYGAAGTLATYYDNPGVSQPFGYWYEWLHHWLVLATKSVPVLRLPALALGICSWVLCRWVLARLLSHRLSSTASVRWSLASVFLVCFLSWDLTFRPEPIVAFLAGGALAAMTRFTLRPSPGPLVVAGLCVVLGVTAHPEGLITLAPVVASAGFIGAWLRPRSGDVLRPVIASGLALGALGLLLAFVDSDIGHRREDSASIRFMSHSLDWRDELLRYAYLSNDGAGTALRRASVALMGAAVIGFLFRRVRPGMGVLAGRSLVLGFVALLITPSKWPWHFGALTVLGAVAVAVEVARLVEERPRTRPSWSIRPLLAISVVLVGAFWAWSIRRPWVPLDLRTLGWPAHLGAVLPPLNHVRMEAFLLLLVIELLVLAGVATLFRRGRRWLPDVPWQVGAWIVAIVSVPLLIVTIATFVRDATVTDGWTLARQNVESLRGSEGCALGDEVIVPNPATFNALATIRPHPSAREPASPIGSPPLQGGRVWGSLPDGGPLRHVVTPWFSVPSASPVGIFVAGHPAVGRTLSADWGERRTNGVRTVSHGNIVSRPPRSREKWAFAWRFLAQGDLPPRPPGANALRLVATNRNVTPDWSLMIGSPAQYRTHTLAAWLGRNSERALVHPALALYLPCLRQPTLARGVVEEPRALVLLSADFWPVAVSDSPSPFSAVTYMERTLEVSTADSRLPPRGVSVLAVDRSPRPGEALAPVSVGSSR